MDAGRRNLLILLLFSCVLKGQQTISTKVQYGISPSVFVIKPDLTLNDYGITRKRSGEAVCSLWWSRLVQDKFGILVSIDVCAQTSKFSYRAYNGGEQTARSSPGTLRNSFSIGLLREFKLKEHLKFSLAVGPQLHLCKFNNDLYDDPLGIPEPIIESYIIRRVGYGYRIATNLNYEWNSRFGVLLSAWYQKGFLYYRETAVSGSYKYSILSYNGTGIGVGVGISFRPYN
jgi:hypothetical protein